MDSHPNSVLTFYWSFGRASFEKIEFCCKKEEEDEERGGGDREGKGSPREGWEEGRGRGRTRDGELL